LPKGGEKTPTKAERERIGRRGLFLSLGNIFVAGRREVFGCEKNERGTQVMRRPHLLHWEGFGLEREKKTLSKNGGQNMKTWERTFLEGENSLLGKFKKKRRECRIGSRRRTISFFE